MNIADEIKKNFREGNNLIKLIYINIAVFAIIELFSTIYFLVTKTRLEEFFSYYLAFPSNMISFITKPWTIITYMFVHAGIWHILFNLLWLYWFGQIFLQYLDQRRLLIVYLLGGIAGAVLYALAYNIFPAFHLERFGSNMVGASAAIMAVVIAISTIVPNYTINLLLLGQVKLKYIAIFTIFVDLISVQSENAGGHIAHLGGALFGYIFAVRYAKGQDLTKGVSSFFDSINGIFKPKPKMKVGYKRTADEKEYNRMKVDQQKEVDRILDKIAKGGYDSLSRNEKDFLFRSSK